MKRPIAMLVVTLWLLPALEAVALVIPIDEGRWPDDWPQELEPLRERASTLDVATGTQEHIYTIPFEDREEFETYWPILLSLRTPGSPLTLTQVGAETGGWGDLISNAKPCVRIKGPAHGALAGNERVGPSWPKEIIGPQGALPEYVTRVHLNQRETTWAPIEDVPEHQRGFHHRARVDIELVVDGEVIDLNRIPLPRNTRMIDRRFELSPE